MSRAIADKTDAGFAYKLLTPDVAKAVSAAIKQTNTKPNSYVDIFKMRRGKYRRVRVFRETNLGTMRSKDCFVTDEFYNLISVDIIFARDKNSMLTKEEINTATQQVDAEEAKPIRQMKVTL